MATPIAHIVLANKLFEKYFSNLDKRDFIVGTSFPDIRYLGVIDRTKTHFPDQTTDKLKNKESFLTGLLFHNLVDKYRERHVFDSGVYEMFYVSYANFIPPKLAEDELLYDKIENWQEIISYFNEILPQELELVKDQEAIKKWHRIITDYLRQKPNDDMRRSILISIGFPAEYIDETNKAVNDLLNNPKEIKIIDKLYNNFEELLKIP